MTSDYEGRSESSNAIFTALHHLSARQADLPVESVCDVVWGLQRCTAGLGERALLSAKTGTDPAWLGARGQDQW